MALANTLRTAASDPAALSAASAVTTWSVLWVLGQGFFSLQELHDGLLNDDVPARSLAAITSLAVALGFCRLVELLVLPPVAAGGVQGQDIHSLAATHVIPVLLINFGLVAGVAGPEPFHQGLWHLWFTFYATVAGVNALCERHGQTAPPQPGSARGVSASIRADVALAIAAAVVNVAALAWLLYRAGFSGLFPVVWIKWCHEGWKELIRSTQLLGHAWIQSRPESAFVFGWSVQSLAFELESVGKIAWRAVQLLSGVYLLWVDGMSTITVNLLVYFRCKTQWRALGVEISKRISRAALDGYIHRACPQRKLDSNEHCPICLERMTTASVLPCSHQFHFDCLRSWVKDQRTCPTCRQGISLQPDDGGGAGPGARDGFWDDAVRWLFTLGGPTPQEIEEMAARLHVIFPDVPLAVIERDLFLTGSMEVTADRMTRLVH